MNQDFKNVVYMYKFPNGKVYIGVTNNEKRRRSNHHSVYVSKNNGKTSQPFYNALIFYGWNNVEYRIICRCRSYCVALQMEKNYIKKYRSYIGYSDSNGYNSTLGGEGALGVPMKDYHKDIIRMTHRGRKQTPEQILNRVTSFKSGGKINTNPETFATTPRTLGTFKGICKTLKIDFLNYDRIEAPKSCWNITKIGFVKKYFFIYDEDRNNHINPIRESYTEDCFSNKPRTRQSFSALCKRNDINIDNYIGIYSHTNIVKSGKKIHYYIYKLKKGEI